MPAHTFVATVEAVTQAGATPVLVDVGEADGTMDPAAAAAAVTARTRALMPVHLYGHMADMRAVLAVARRAGAAVIEDACQAHGAERDGAARGRRRHRRGIQLLSGQEPRRVRRRGRGRDRRRRRWPSGCARCASTARPRSTTTSVEGYTARLDTIQAIVLLRKLPLLDGLERRAPRGGRDLRRGARGRRRPRAAPHGGRQRPGLAPVRRPHARSATRSRRTWPPAASAPACTTRSPSTCRPRTGTSATAPGAFPVTERYTARCLSLPLFPGIRESQLERVVEAVAEFFGHGR